MSLVYLTLWSLFKCGSLLAGGGHIHLYFWEQLFHGQDLDVEVLVALGREVDQDDGFTLDIAPENVEIIAVVKGVGYGGLILICRLDI